MAGAVPLREVLALTTLVDCVAGPESAIINAAGCFTTPKIALLSHSSPKNLCANWLNDYSLMPEQVPCYPCNQLHYTKASCPLVQILRQDTQEVVCEAPACAAAGISGERIQARLDHIYAEWRATAPF